MKRMDFKSELFIDQYIQLRDQEARSEKRFLLDEKYLFPCLNDNTPVAVFDRHYVYHLGWAAATLKKINPLKHIDVASSLYFSSIICAFLEVEFYDYRPADLQLDNLKSLAGNLLSLPFEDNSIESISSMHVVEHVGLGRYGDPLDYDGDIKAINELIRILAPGGNLLFVVPVGAKDKICFNAHRIYSKSHILSLFSKLVLKEFVLIPDNQADGGLITDPDMVLLSRQNYGCGCFWFTKYS